MAIVANNWKPVTLEGNLFNNQLADGLIGLEVCTNYDNQALFTGKKKRKKRNLKVKKAKKSKIEATVNDELGSPQNQESTIDDESAKQTDSNCTTNDTNESLWDQFALPESVSKRLKELGFQQPTEIQTLTLPAAILGRRDILGAAETGSGKTLAFGLPIISGILKLKSLIGPVEEPQCETESESEAEHEDHENDIGCVKSHKLAKSASSKPLYALILTPTRELAMQVKNHLTSVAKYTGLNIAVIVGGMAIVKQERVLSNCPEIVIGTPGRLWELIQQGNEHLSKIASIRFLAIDETDRMLERGHFKELHDLLEKINYNQAYKTRQNFVFSATLTLIHDIPKHLVNKMKMKGKRVGDMSAERKLTKIVETLGITDPKIVDLSQGTGISGTLTEYRITCALEEKDYFVYYFLKQHPGRTLIFCNSIGCVKRLSNLLSLLECQPLTLHASMQQRQRLKNLERFRDVDGSILIATDVAARGLDIPKVEHVLHYQTPRTSESYVHRSGRTARASNKGITVLIMDPSEFRNYIKLCKTLEKKEDLPIFPVENRYLNAIKERVNLAKELDKLQLHVRKANSEEGWLQKAAEEMNIIIDEMPRKYDREEKGSNKRLADIKKKQLTGLLATPIFPKGFTGKFPLLEHASSEILLQKGVNENAVKATKPKKKSQIPLYKPSKDKATKVHNVFIKLDKYSLKNRSKKINKKMIHKK